MNVALYLKPPWSDKILDSSKTWEIRGTPTKKRELIGILKSGNGGFMEGQVELVDCFQTTKEELDKYFSKHHIQDVHSISYKKIYVWVLKNPLRYEDPIQINPTKGAIIWVKLRKDLI